MMEVDLCAFIKADAGVIAKIGDRLYPVVIPQTGHVPCVVFQRLSSLYGQTLCGTDSSVRGAFQFDAYDKTYFGARDAANAIKTALLDYSGTMGGTRVDRVSLETETDLSDPEPGLYRVSLTFNIFYQE